MVTVEKLIERAKAVGLPIANIAFEETEETPVPEPPYLVYLVPHQKNRGADAVNNIKETDFSLELYTDKFDTDRESLEEMVEDKVFFDVETDKYVATVESENMVQSAWEVNGLIQKKKGAKQ